MVDDTDRRPAQRQADLSETVAEPVRPTADAPQWPPAAARPERIGPFEILDVLGEGGMGTVYLAEQTSPMRRKVALKLIRSGAVDAQRLARFAAEREALARMSHPNIAQVYTAGTSHDGQPWIAMEYVPGVPLTEYCDARRMPIARRVELFLTVCDAIQHAHQKALLHRDLKPSNVLVADSEGGPLAKVIDFGVAKALDDPILGGRRAGTVVVGTPTYLSPESIAAARGETDLDTRSDVYGLGLLLFELLTGAQPFGFISSLAVLQRIVEGDVPRPSAYFQTLLEGERARIAADRATDAAALRRGLRGDLDWIVLKAMARDREQRYSSAAELAADLRRHLDDLPVLAGPPSAAYRLRKFARRHRTAVAAAVLVGLALVGGLVARSLEARRANREAERAGREARTAQEVSQFLVGLFQGSDPGRNARPDTTARELLDRGAARVRKELGSQPQVKARLLDAISRIYRQLGVYDDAAKLALESLALSEVPGTGDPLQTAENLLNLGTIYELQGRGDTAEPLLRRALATFSGTADRAAIAACKMELASVASHAGRYAEAERLSLETIDDWTAALGPDNERVGAALNNLANMYYDQHRWADAEHAHLRAIAIKTKVFGEEHYYVAQSMSNLANVYVEQGRLDEAEALAQKALAIKRRVLPPAHFEIGISIHNLGDVALKGGHADRAAALYAQAIAFWESIPAAGKAYVSYSLVGLANALRDLGRLPEAKAKYAEARARLAGPNAELEREIAEGERRLDAARAAASGAVH